MSMRIFSALIFALVTSACGRPDDSNLVAAEAAQRASADDDGRIICATDGSADFARVCTLDRVADAQGLMLTVHHPDGGFRRLRVTTDGRGVVAADGAEAAGVKVAGDNRIEVVIAGDRYLLPATIKSPR